MDPEQISLRAATERAAKREAQRNPENWGADGKTLGRQADVVVISGMRGKVQTARRDDVFDRLLAREALDKTGHQAIRRLEADMIERRGEGFKNPVTEVVDSSGTRDVVTQRMIDAGRRVDGALDRIGRRDAVLLKELIEPNQIVVEEGVERWRQVVRVIAGETNPQSQSGAIRCAAGNLVFAYQEIDHQPRSGVRR